MHIDTKLIHGGISGDKETGAVSVPVYRTSTFKQTKLGGNPRWEYSRTGNPTRYALETQMADLENGTAGFAFSSGTAAINTILSMYSQGDHIIVGQDLYGGTIRLINQVMKRFGLEFTAVDMQDPNAVENAFRDNTKAIYFETPTNPLLTVADIKKLSEIAKKHGAKTIVDNTFATPYNQNPLDLGADVVVHSATKYLGGHSDVVAGIAITNDDKIAEQLAFLQNSIGSTLGPDDSWLVQRGIKTLGARMRVHQDNTNAILNFLKNEPKVAKVYYPGDPENPNYEVAKKQMRNFGPMISFELQPGLSPKTFVESLQIITLAESLGGVESLIEVPAVMTHGSVPREERLKDGIADGLIRLSVGIEDKEDLLDDLKQAFDKI
ncbi:trans-sulfuration enzyme family protein [Fructilactobacillus fructivorans]|uniref:Cystathionine beta-lyase n=1 Tax=Fructilactobacillus fructivorans TaxID=1614 RepID=A0AAE6P2R1_9LACO|nr:PLP-dependent aspartate aminotransferase family protein [Fructilactobacillus fructivorans]KRK56886.1 cystathionine gamma-lyase [Fructilactobacillus fructivorans]KRN43065.1 cystathionine gamma-lyase [Fructilactobacillus fructivorans]QFX93258.1 aminotransferase class V-fold PLP-dependent enzyme [Fructilactobacillus fructivorans]RDV65078.1 PLP-dependent transferase [Fructilactobacillus fructivorans]